jgi:hypothetical protein
MVSRLYLQNPDQLVDIFVECRSDFIVCVYHPEYSNPAGGSGKSSKKFTNRLMIICQCANVPICQWNTTMASQDCIIISGNYETQLAHWHIGTLALRHIGTSAHWQMGKFSKDFFAKSPALLIFKNYFFGSVMCHFFLHQVMFCIVIDQITWFCYPRLPTPDIQLHRLPEFCLC